MKKTYLVFLKIPANATVWSGLRSSGQYYQQVRDEVAKDRKERLENYLAAKSGEKPSWVRSDGAFKVEMEESLVPEVEKISTVRKVVEEGDV
jgi:hypothetical protein